MASAYQIGINIALTDNVSQVLSVISKRMLGVNASAAQLQGTLNRVKLAAIGAAGVLGGSAVIKSLGAAVGKGAELVEQEYQLRRLGLDNNAIISARASAYKAAADVQGTEATRNMEILRELKGAIGDLPEAQALLNSFAKADIQLGGNDRNLQAAMKAIEVRGDIQIGKDGKLDMARATAGLDAAVKFLQASGGQIDGQTLKGLITMAGPMAKMMDPQAFYRTMLTVTEELGLKAGTALSAAGRALYGGIMPQRNAYEMERLHLLDASKVTVRRGGNVQVNQGALAGFDVLNGPGGLAEWSDKVLRPKLHQDYLQAQIRNPKLQEAQFDQQELYRLFPTETMRRIVGIFLQQAGSVAKGAQNFDAATGLGANEIADQNSPVVRMKAFTAAWENLQTALGAPLVETAYNALGMVTAKLTAFSQWAAANPETVQRLGFVVAGLAALAVTLGAFAIGAAAFTALTALAGPIGITALAAGVTALAVAFPPLGDAIKAVLGVVLDAVKGWAAFATDTAKGLADISRSVVDPVGALKGPNNIPHGPMPYQFKGDGAPAGNDNGAPVHKESYVPPTSGGNARPVHNIIYMDGRKVADTVTTLQTRDATRAPAGQTPFDLRMTPMPTGMAVNL